MDQKRFAGLQPTALEHIVPDRHQGFRDCAGFQDRQRRRNGHGLGVLRDAILGVAAAATSGHHLVAELVFRGSCASANHFTGDFEAGQVAGAGRRRIGAGALRDVGAVDAGGHHLDQDFARAGTGTLRVSGNALPDRRAC